MYKHQQVFWISMAIFATPIIPAGVSVLKLMRKPEDRNLSTLLPIGIVLLSFGFMFSGGFHPAVWGSDYSNLRFNIICTNFVISLLAALLAVTSRPKLQMWTLVAALMLAAVWAFVYAINSVV